MPSICNAGNGQLSRLLEQKSARRGVRPRSSGRMLRITGYPEVMGKSNSTCLARQNGHPLKMSAHSCQKIFKDTSFFSHYKEFFFRFLLFHLFSASTNTGSFVNLGCFSPHQTSLRFTNFDTITNSKLDSAG